jgi:hypothetical protein
MSILVLATGISVPKEARARSSKSFRIYVARPAAILISETTFACFGLDVPDRSIHCAPGSQTDAIEPSQTSTARPSVFESFYPSSQSSIFAWGGSQTV